MIQVEYKLKVGQDDFTLKADVKDEKEFFEKMSFYSTLPRVGPNGENDLKITFRTTAEGYKYYSLVSEKSGMEFKFGQSKDIENGALFPKGWEKLYQRDTNAQPTNTVAVPVSQPVPTPVQASVPVQPQVAQPVQQPIAVPASATVVSPAVKDVANDVLARFGIKQG